MAGSPTLLAEPAGLFLAGLQGERATLSRAEFRAAFPTLFKTADTDGSGDVRAIELEDWRKTQFGSADGWPGLNNFDTDMSGAISQPEFAFGLGTIFDQFDADKDGVLTRAELLAAKQVRGAGPEIGPGMLGGGRRRPGP